ncbi:hypothetical protein DPMN_009667, partial [Dreissena polymorpha]
MKLDRYIDHDLQTTPIDFQVTSDEGFEVLFPAEFFFPGELFDAYPGSITDCDDAMKTMVKGTECVRRTVLKELRTKDMNPIPAQ